MKQTPAHTLSVLVVLLALTGGCATATRGPDSPSTADPAGVTNVTNPLVRGADPWVFEHRGAYYLLQSSRDRGVVLYKSDTFGELGERHDLWRAPRTGPHCRQVWAPELHHLDGRWYLYVAASDGENANHRTVVLESASDDPLSAYTFKGELFTGDAGGPNRWAIDATVLEVNGKRYFLWSGWETTEDVQYLYIAEMENPWTTRGGRVKLAANDEFDWEHVNDDPAERGLHEGPQVLQRNGRTFLTYSTAGAWLPTYKLGMLELKRGADPMDPASWTKFPEPVFASSADIYGVGHASFVKGPDGRDWIAYHAKTTREEGFGDRVIRLQPFTWSADGLPVFGEPR